MRLAKERIRNAENGVQRLPHAPWRCMKPLLGGLAVTALLSAPLPAKADALVKPKTAISAQAQTNAPETKETPEQRKKERLLETLVCAGLVGAVGLYVVLKQTSK